MIVFISSISILATRAICSREKPSLCIFKINSAFSSSRPSALPFSNAFSSIPSLKLHISFTSLLSFSVRGILLCIFIILCFFIGSCYCISHLRVQTVQPPFVLSRYLLRLHKRLAIYCYYKAKLPQESTGFSIDKFYFSVSP